MSKWGGMNTLRNQIFAGFTVTMIVVLSFAGVYIFGQVSDLLRNSAEKHIQQTAVQMNGRLDALLGQIDSLTTEVVTNSYVQNLLLNEVSGVHANFNERQSLLQIVNGYMSYSSGIQSLELYTKDYHRLFPLDDISLPNRVSEEWIREADQTKGRLVWAGLDPRQPNTVLAVRRVSLIDHGYSAGGYVAVRIHCDYFDMNESEDENDSSSNEYMLLADGRGQTITSDLTPKDAYSVLKQSGGTVKIGGEKYLAVRQNSAKTGWSLVLLTPIQATTEGISVLRTALYVSIGVGAVAFLLLSLLLSTVVTRPILKLMRTMRSARIGGLKENPSPAPKIASLEIRELNNTYNQMVAHMNELIQVVYEKEITQSRTELKALQAQINPHFLFNTLEAFYWSLDEKGEEELARIVVAMSGLFRYVIGKTGMEDEWVTINDELEHVERYLQIMTMRLGDRLSWRIEAEPGIRNVPIPKLLIQPLVENAILHGVEGKLGPGSVAVEAFASPERPGCAVLKVSDDGPGMDEETVVKLLRSAESRPPGSSKRGTGVAIANVQRRLKLYFPDKTEEAAASGLKIDSEPGRGTSISFEIKIPRTEESTR
ncbi:sensor histidine kinase [Cohnella sp. AR92]|uniref:cache domain-containing sensor histidine kinase n=1 Tax=Cohnella sp. AR92 TaxID=648716 RepID=UPI000F8CA5AA|nr:sensor histidine kinase [Cohnella sp. AR92]RUS47908.1 sensor histidine kinase [Cohnella sp. AR92]